MTEDSDDRAAIETLVSELNDAWLAERIDDLGDYFDADAVLVAPGGERRIVGRAEITASYQQYVEMARTLAFDVRDVGVDVVGATAVARVAFTVRYAIGESTYDEAGTDLLVLAKRAGRWRIAWRTQIPAESPPG